MAEVSSCFTPEVVVASLLAFLTVDETVCQDLVDPNLPKYLTIKINKRSKTRLLCRRPVSTTFHAFFDLKKKK